MNLSIRNVKSSDAARLLEIYSYYVENTAVSFECEVPSFAEFENRIITTKEKYPYIVCECDGKVAGYAYAGPYSSRGAYAWTVTTSIYVDKDYRRCQIGSLLYTEIEKELKEMGMVNVLAAVAYTDPEDERLTHDSYKFHTKMGYEKVAQLKGVGKKFGKWYDILWMQKVLQP